MNKNIIIIASSLLLAVVVVAAYAFLSSKDSSHEETPMNPNSPRVTLDTNYGDIVIELYPDKAPKTVENFLGYVQSGDYDKTIFHRVINNFMIQGGGFVLEGNVMRQKASKTPIQNEADNGLKNDRGTIAMARTSQPHSASNQFFINHKDNAFLNFKSQTPQGWGYAVFGKVVEGMNVVDEIAKVETTNVGGHGDVPSKAVVINSAKLSE